MPTTSNTALRRLTLGALLTGAGVLTALALSTAAHADDTQQPGGVLGTVVEVVDKTRPEPAPTADPEPAEPAEEAPVEEAPVETERADEPAPVARTREPDRDEPQQDEQQQDAAEDTPAAETLPGRPDTVTDLVEQVAPPAAPVAEVVTAPLPTTPAPVVVVPAPAPVIVGAPIPAVAEAPQPAADEREVTESAVTETPAAPAVDIPAPAAQLPVAGPTAGTTTLLPGLTPAPASGDQADDAPQCGHQQADDVAPARDQTTTRTTTAKRHGTAPGVDRQPAPIRPCPTPGGPGTHVDVHAATPPPGHAALDLSGTPAAGLTWPVLARLTQLRPRGDLPAGRTEHPEPGPA